jgi:hypothetical protein
VLLLLLRWRGAAHTARRGDVAALALHRARAVKLKRRNQYTHVLVCQIYLSIQNTAALL